MGKRWLGKYKAAIPQQLASRFAYDDCGRLEYIGETFSEHQNETAKDVWRIRKINYLAGSGCPEEYVSITWADGNEEFAFTWDEREGYGY